MSDLRETILTRLFTVLQGVTGFDFCGRMVPDVPEDTRPALVLDDGSEEPRDTPFSGSAPNIVTMYPRALLYISRSELEAGNLNALRAAVIKAVVSDDDLKAHTSVHGSIRYHGCETGLSRGELLEADMAVIFSITYPLKPADL